MRSISRLLPSLTLVIVALVLSTCGPEQSPCEADSDCPSGQVCEEGACVAETPTDGQDAGPRCTPGLSCRAKAGDCDVEEICSADGICPPDVLVMGGTVCRAPAGPCDLDERCTGTSPQCPPDALSPETTVCRSSAGGCDPEETCPGNGAQCPPDVIEAVGAVCRPSAGDCDVEETCDGTSEQCPSDTFLPDTTECRPAEGGCDIAEFCSGSAAACPVDAIEAAAAICRAPVNACDLAEACDGASKECPADAFQPANTPCAAATCSMGTATPARTCAGGSATCQMVTPISCNGYQCNGTGCGTSCATSADCLSTHFCQPGNQCAPKKLDGQSCSGASSDFECVSNACTGSYVDGDGDGSGTGAIGYFCGSSPPAGRASSSGDCCDSDNRARPGQTTYFTTARGCGGGHDFNCDGSSSKQYTAADACNEVGSCGIGFMSCVEGTGWSATSSPACGVSGTYITSCNAAPVCNPSTCPGCQQCLAQTTTRTQGCR